MPTIQNSNQQTHAYVFILIYFFNNPLHLDVRHNKEETICCYFCFFATLMDNLIDIFLGKI